MINERLLWEVRPCEGELADAVQRAGSYCENANPGKATKKKIIAINTDHRETG